jgi:cytochrome c2
MLGGADLRSRRREAGARGLRLLFSLGDNAFDGVNANLAVSQDPDSDYGKTLLIDIDSGAKEVFTIGHRNSIGAVLDSTGTVWATEMGPQGGDELNLIRRGRNYGWPTVTFGTEYGGTVWTPNPHPGDHLGFEWPAYSWVPSVAPSGIIEAGPGAVSPWHGDLLVGTLRAESLLRVRVRDGNVVYVETIPMGLRIRDLAEGSNRIVLWNDDGVLVSVRMSERAQGARLFGLCSSCHALGDGTEHGVGPDLGGIIGRPVAGASGYQFSEALSQVEGRSTEERLLEFLRDPQLVAPGNEMPSVSIPSEQDRAALIRYLRDP